MKIEIVQKLFLIIYYAIKKTFKEENAFKNI